MILFRRGMSLCVRLVKEVFNEKSNESENQNNVSGNGQKNESSASHGFQLIFVPDY